MIIEEIRGKFHCSFDRTKSLKHGMEMKSVLVSGSSTMEKDSDVVVGWRFKKRGVNWTLDQRRGK